MNTIEQQVATLINETLIDLGFDLVSVRLRGANSKTLEVLIDRLDNEKITVADCRKVSRNISALLDVEDIIKDKYYLEVSSSGIERPLTKFDDYIRFASREVTIKLHELLDGKSRYQGKIIKAQDNTIYLSIEDKEVIIGFDLIKNASLVFTDEMFRKLLNRPLL